MKVSSIPKLTSYGNHSVSIRLGSIKRTIQEYQDEDNLEINPDFQRGHVWNEEQQIKYVEFILSGGHTNNEILFNAYHWGRSTVKTEIKMVLVDGLQRLTALIKFLDNELAIYEGVKLNDFDNVPLLLRSIDIKFTVNNLVTRKEVLKWYLELNSNGTPHTEQEISRVKELYSNEQAK